jgi:hypothetical protein
MKITDKIIKSDLIPWRNMKFLQPDGFKDLTKESYAKLRQSILNNHFLESFKVWQDKKIIYCLDGYHRVKVLHELVREGHAITGASIVLGWAMQKGRTAEEKHIARQYLRQWPDGPQLSEEIEQLYCHRCKNTWYPRTPEKPKVCPACKSPYWDIPRKNKQEDIITII